jgi:hypothetical protein
MLLPEQVVSPLGTQPAGLTLRPIVPELLPTPEQETVYVIPAVVEFELETVPDDTEPPAVETAPGLVHEVPAGLPLGHVMLTLVALLAQYESVDAAPLLTGLGDAQLNPQVGAGMVQLWLVALGLVGFEGLHAFRSEHVRV